MTVLSLHAELCLLMLDDATGDFCALEGRAQEFGLAAAALLELSRHGRITVESDRLELVDASTFGDPALDHVLAQIASSDTHNGPEDWVRQLGRESGSQISRACLDQLVEHGILERGSGGLHFRAADVDRSQSYRATSGSVVDEVRLRVMRALFRDGAPEPSDIILIQLADACGVFRCVLTASEFDEARRVIEGLGESHTLCQAAGRAAADARAMRIRERGGYKPIPDVPGLPVFGNAFSLLGEVQPYLIDLYQRHGPICRVRVPGKRIVIMSGKEAVEFARKHSQTHLRNDEAFAPMRQGVRSDRLLIASGGHDHIKLRRSAHEIYASSSVEANLPKIIEIARSVLRKWHATKSVSVYSAMQQLSIMQVGALTFGQPLDEYVDTFRYWNDSLIIAMRGDRPKFLVERRMRKVRSEVQRLFAEGLEEHDPLERTGCPRDVIDDLVDMQRRQPEFISAPDLLSAVITPYFQSSDQIACTLGFALLYMLADQRYAERCQTEADAFAVGTLGTEGLQGLEMTRALITEVLRIHAQAPVMQRTARISFEFEGHWVPAGTELLLATAVVHGDPDVYRDPEKFEPERHLPPRLESQQEGAYAAFGTGAHSCLGKEFASDLMAVDLATILRYAEIDRYPSRDHRVRITSYPLIRPRARCRIQVKRMRDIEGTS